MKSILKLTFAALLLVGMTAQLSAQCTETSGTFTTGAADSPDLIQSFTASCDGTVSSLTFGLRQAYAANEGMGTVEFAEGTCGSSVLATANVFYPTTTGGDVTVNFSSPISVVSGNVYMIHFNPPGTVGFLGSNTNPYTAGGLECIGSAGLTLDIQFSVDIDAAGGGNTGSAACEISSGEPFSGLQIANSAIQGLGQTFTAVCDGPLNTITVDFSNIPNFPLICEVRDDCTGTVLATKTMTATGTSGEQTFVFDTPAMMTEGVVYAFNVSLDNVNSNSLGFVTAAPSDYTGGNICGPWDYDIVFTINEGEEVVAPVPTMGEWALITFGLIIMSMGVITVRRREQDLIVKTA